MLGGIAWDFKLRNLNLPATWGTLRLHRMIKPHNLSGLLQDTGSYITKICVFLITPLAFIKSEPKQALAYNA